MPLRLWPGPWELRASLASTYTQKLEWDVVSSPSKQHRGRAGQFRYISKAFSQCRLGGYEFSPCSVPRPGPHSRTMAQQFNSPSEISQLWADAMETNNHDIVWA